MTTTAFQLYLTLSSGPDPTKDRNYLEIWWRHLWCRNVIILQCHNVISSLHTLNHQTWCWTWVFIVRTRERWRLPVAPINVMTRYSNINLHRATPKWFNPCKHISSQPARTLLELFWRTENQNTLQLWQGRSSFYNQSTNRLHWIDGRW